MRRILITGGAGFIGVNFVYYWLRQYPGDQLVILDKLTYAGCKASLTEALSHSNVCFYEGDIGDRSLVNKLLRDHAIDVVVNFAAESHVDRSIVAPDAFIQTNVVATHHLLDACRDYWLDELNTDEHRFHHVSTDEVYGSLGPADPAFKETTAYQPNSPYSASKAASDHLVRAYHHTYGLNVTTSNCSNNYGPFHFPEKLIPLSITNLLLGKPVPIYGDGKNIRDWLFVEDHCRGIELVLTKGSIGETYNIGGNNEWDNLSLIQALARKLDEMAGQGQISQERFPQAAMFKQGAENAIEFVADRPGHDRRYAVDAGKIGKQLGYKPMVDLEQGLERTVIWYMNNEQWWRPLLKRATFS